MLTNKPDIIILVETNLTCGIKDSELCLDNYCLFRRDRYQFGPNSKGGGILVAIRSDLCPMVLFCNYETDCEQLFIKFSHLDKQIIIGAVYIPPCSTTDIYKIHTNTVENLHAAYSAQSDFIIIGDYNLTGVNWKNSVDVDDSLNIVCDQYITSLTKDCADVIVNSFSFLNLCQRCDIHQDKGYTLDLCFTSLDYNKLINCPVAESILPLDRHHNPASFIFKFINNVDVEPVSFKKNFYKTNFEVIQESLVNIDWNVLLSHSDVESNTSTFNSCIQGLINDNVPDMKNNIETTYPPWFSFDLIRNIIIKKKLHKLWLSTNDHDDFIEFKKQRAICLRMSRLDQRKYYEELQDRTSKNIKEFWKYIGKLSKKNTVPAFVNYKGYTSASLTDTCNLFATYFKSTFSSTSTGHSIVEMDDLIASEVDFNISEIDITLALYKLSDSVSIGADGFPQVLVKKCGYCLIEPMKLLFNQSLLTGSVPSVWKKSYITPVFKAGDNTNVENYRPITIMGTFAKILDSIVAAKLTLMLVSRVIGEQHGFLEGRSTLTNLIFYTDDISNSLNSCRQVDSVYLDFSKAFDSVNHSLLLSKLKNFGLSRIMLNWLGFYLIGRTSVVRLKGNLSDPFVVNSGVPQGSHLGPFLFLLFINDISSKLQFSRILIFADDIKLFNQINSPRDQSRLQTDLDTIVQWAEVNDLRLNIDKCSFISFRRGYCFQTSYLINDSPLRRVSEVKDLGVIFQDNFEFHLHLDVTVSKAFKMLGFIYRTASRFSTSTIIYLYKTLVRPILLYNSTIWSPHHESHIRKLESLQHKFFRYLAFRRGTPFSFDDHDFGDFAAQVGLCSIKSLHDYYDILFVKKSMQAGALLSSLFLLRENRYNTRGHRQLEEKSTNKDYVFHSSLFRLRRVWNLLDINIKGCDKLGDFKSCLRDFIYKFE